MTKLTRKLFVSMLTVAFAVITLGATTFAWFTLSNKAQVQQFTAQVTSGAGIEISLDGNEYTSTITTGEILNRIVTNLGNPISLDDVSSNDGIVFNTIVDSETVDQIDDGTEVIGVDNGYIWFNLFFRSPQAGVKVYMLNNSYTGSNGIDWISDAQFNYRDATEILVGGTATLYAANALRIAYQEFAAVNNAGVISYPTGAVSAKIFELDPTNNLYHAVDNPTGNEYLNQRLDTTLVTTYGSVAYWNAKYPNDNINTTLAGTLPTVLNNAAMTDPNQLTTTPGTNHVATLSTQLDAATGTDYYYGSIRVRIWLEGWDPDCYNAIMADTIQVYLNFGGSTI